ncbi:acyltransferase family protein [Pseudolysinimonas sp.]|uniref:acyltransferase family protein n=1 Tax=Pseudolysinimonas sp. TaxID=2680009 RepID=UPI003F81E825
MADSERFRPDIQGLRAIAVAAVVLNHAGIPFVSGGYVGVDVFFVVSGFLISTHLLTGLERDGRIRFASFYARRARRILPAALVVLALSIVGAMIWVPPLLRPQVLKDAIATALYVPNYAFAAQGTDYLAQSSTPSLFQHYWSLGIEEQFYLVWPALLALVWLAGRRSRRALAVVLIVVVASSLACAVQLTFVEQPWAFFSLWSRAWELGAGGLVALVLRARARALPPMVAGVGGWLGLGGIAAAAVRYSSATAFPGWAAALPVAATALVILAGATPTRYGPQLLLGTRPLQFIGLISYPLYLVHWPILQLAQAARGAYEPLPLWAAALLAAGSAPVAWLLHRVVEDPARRARVLAAARPRRSLIGAGVGAAVTAGLAVGAIALTAIQPLHVATTVAVAGPTDPPRVTGVVASNLRPSLAAAADDNPALYADGCEVGYTSSIPHPCTYGSGDETVVLFGDSHAAQWYPALQRVVDRRGATLVTQTKSACASIDIALSRGGAPYTACATWRAAVIAQLRADPPDLVVLADYANPDFLDDADADGQWRRGLDATITELRAVTRVAVIADTPDLRDSPSVCLSAHLSDAAACARPASLALDAPGREATVAATAATGTPLIDLTDYFCTEQCAPIIGNVLVYRDSHHITATYAAELADPLGCRLLPHLASAAVGAGVTRPQ